MTAQVSAPLLETPRGGCLASTGAPPPSSPPQAVIEQSRTELSRSPWGEAREGRVARTARGRVKH